MVSFTKKVLKLKEEITPSSYVYLLLHKTDLISRNKLSRLKDSFDDKFHDEKLFKIAYTSIMKDSFLPTFTLFTEILTQSLGIEKPEEDKYSLKFLEYSISILDIIDQNVVITKEEIQKKMKLPDNIFNKFIEYLEGMKFLEVSTLDIKSMISLSKSGKKYFDEIVGTFSIEALRNFKKKIETTKIKEIPPFLGLMIADKNGRALTVTEVYDGAFKILLNFKTEEEKKTELELIPMFISALEKFAEEINIQDLPGFNLEGSNLKIQTVKYDICTFCLFMRSDVNFKTFKVQIIEWFDKMVEIYKSKIEKSILDGNVSYFDNLEAETKKWLEDLNQNYNNLLLNFEIYDFEQVKQIFQKLEDLHVQYEFKYTIIQEKLKKMKIDLMIAASECDYQIVKNIVKMINELDVQSN